VKKLGHDNIAGNSTNTAWNDQNQLIPKQLVNSVGCVDFNLLWHLSIAVLAVNINVNCKLVISKVDEK